MKKYVKNALFYILLAVCLLVFTAFENFPRGSILYFRPSLTVCICLCLARPQLLSVIICAVYGITADIFSLCLPVFSLLYLYISSGCVWSVRLFVSFSKKAVFFTCFFALAGFCVMGFLIDFLLFENFALSAKTALYWVLFSLINASLSPIVYGILKRAEN